jgi:hypothetical protein
MGDFKPLPPRTDLESGDVLPEAFTLGVKDNFDALASTDPLSGASLVGFDPTTHAASGSNSQAVLDNLLSESGDIVEFVGELQTQNVGEGASLVGFDPTTHATSGDNVQQVLDNIFDNLLDPADQPTAELKSSATKAVTPATARGAAGTALTRKIYDTVSVNDALALENKLDDDSLATVEFDMGDTAPNTRLSFRIIGGGVSMTSMKLKLGKTGAPLDNLVVRIETDSSGNPSGTLVHANATANVSGPGLTTSQVVTTVTFAGAFTPVKGTEYHVVIQRSGALDAADYYNVSGASDTVKVHKKKNYNGSAWVASSGVLYFEEITAGSFSTGLALGDANNYFFSNFDCFAYESGVDSDSILTVSGGLMDGFSNIIANAPVFLSNTAGEITTTNTGVKVGEGIDSGTLLIKKDIFPFSYTGNPNIAATSDTLTIDHDLGVIPNWIEVFAVMDGVPDAGNVFATSISNGRKDHNGYSTVYQGGAYDGIGSVVNAEFNSTTKIIHLAFFEATGSNSHTITATVVLTKKQIKLSFLNSDNVQRAIYFKIKAGI